MANCPNCGSNHIQLKTDKNINWGRAVAGWALLGVVGGVVGAVTGNEKNVIGCLDCGTTWQAADVYQILQTIKTLTGISLDLAEENHRLYMKNFMQELGSCLESISKVEKKAVRLIAEAENKKAEGASYGCAYGCLISIVGCHSLLKAASGGNLMLTVILPPLIGIIIGVLFDKSNKKSINRKVELAKAESERMRIEAEDDLRNKLHFFMDNNIL